MSENKNAKPAKKANERPKYAPVKGIGFRHAASGEKAVNFGPSLRRLLKRMRPERMIFVFVVLMGSLAVLGSVIGPRILGKATDVIFSGVISSKLPAGMPVDKLIEMLRAKGQAQFADMLAGMSGIVPGTGIDFSALGHWVLLAICIYVTSALLKYGQNFWLNRAVQRMIYRMRKETHAKLDRLPLSYFDKQPRGELLSRITNDTDNVSQTLQQTLGQLLTAVLMITGVVIMMFQVSWELALISLATLPVAGLVSMLIGKKAQKEFAKMWQATGELNGQMEEAYTGQQLVKVFGRQAEVSEQVAETNQQLYRSAFRAQAISGLMMPVNFLIGNIGYVLIAVIGGLRVAHGQLSLGNVQAFIQYQRMFTQPVTQIASMANLLQSGVASAERIFEVLDAEEMPADGDTHLPAEIKGRVVFDQVDFSYTPDQDLIKQLSLVAEPGQTIAIVGPTGAGKTTLVNLLERFYELDGGQITLDGVPTDQVPRDELRKNFGMVLQDTWLFGGTIEENIAYGKHGATREDIREAARAAHVDRFVHQLPDGYQTVIDAEANNISAGEKQLITIARAFIADPQVLILDEATSSVDTRTELLVQEAMNRLRHGRTSFVIAHRLSTIRDADVILVMEHGAIVEQGNHEELIAKKQAYYRLYQSQFNAASE